jgi:hypothetical protein
MAKRFGSAHSPDTDTQDRSVHTAPNPVLAFKARKKMRHGAKVNILFMLALLSVIVVFFQPVTAMIVDLAGTGCLFLAAWVTREGLRAEDAYHARIIARRPRAPRKMMGAVAVALGVGLLVFGGGWHLVPAILMAALAGMLHIAAFGLDPMRNKGVAGHDGAQTQRIARKIQEAEAVLDDMTIAIDTVHDRQLTARVARFGQTVRQMFRQVESDPRDLAAARKYLGVYLQGARDATRRFVDIYTRGRDKQIRVDYLAFLDDLDQSFADHTSKLLSDDRTDFDIEIEVLQNRLKRETLRSPSE